MSVTHSSTAAAATERPSPADWPITAAMINFAGTVSPESIAARTGWRPGLAQVVETGFTEVDLTDSWLAVAELSVAERAALRDDLADFGLTVPAISTARRSIIDAGSAEANLDYSHRLIDIAPEFGASIVSFGLFQALTEAQKSVLWFWTVDGHRDSDDRELWNLAVSRYQELCDHAAAVGVELTLEMYEDTYLGTARSSLALLEAIDRPNIGLNPDLGNLVRVQRPIEPWRELIELTLPVSNYWHIKNYARFEHPSTGLVLTTPASLQDGFIDYRFAVRFALEHGYTGPLCVEHYGGDGLGQSARNRDYLRELLHAALV